MRTSRLVVAAGSAAALICGAAGPAAAGDHRWRVVETAAGVSWVEQDADDGTGRPGTVHIGGLFFTQVGANTDVFAGSLADWNCEPGHLPWQAGADCTLVAQYEVSTADVDLRLDQRAGTAHVVGTLTFFDLSGAEEDVWTAPVDLRWTSEGRPVHTRSRHVDRSGSGTSVTRTRTLTWAGVEVRGAVGSMDVGDEAGELDEARLWQDDTRGASWERPAASRAAG